MTDNRASSMAKPSMHFDESYLRWFRGNRRNRVFPEFVDWNGVGGVSIGIVLSNGFNALSNVRLEGVVGKSVGFEPPH